MKDYVTIKIVIEGVVFERRSSLKLRFLPLLDYKHKKTKTNEKETIEAGGKEVTAEDLQN